MNKKIRELSEQADFQALDIFEAHPDFPKNAPFDYFNDNRNRIFAELIVQECAKIAQGDRGGDEYWRARASARADILKHFGIANLEHLGDKV